MTAGAPRAHFCKERTAARTPWGDFCVKFRRQKLAMLAGGFVLGLIAVAAVSSFVTPFDPENFFDYDALNAGPSIKHWFGVDALGRDIFSRILAGTRISLMAGFSSVLVGAVIGSLLGLVAGYFEGWHDRIIMRICDVLFAFPGILLAIGIVAILGNGMSNVIIAVFPSLAIFLTVLAFNLLGDGLRDALDPKIEQR
jgi:glutathione transport system permease protein